MKRAFVATALAIAALTSGSCRANDLAPFQRGSFAAIRAQHAGKKLMVHFWSASCGPCLAELPRLAEMRAKSADFDLVMVSADPIIKSERTMARLERAHLLAVPNFAFADDFVERLHFEVDHDWRGELPFTALIEPDGAMETVTGPLDDAKFRAWEEAAPNKIK